MTAQQSLPVALAGLGAVALVVRVVPRSRPWNEEWRTRHDVALVVLVGTMGAIAMSFWMLPRVYNAYPVWASSFTDYCELVAWRAVGSTAAHNNTRSTIGAWIPSLLAPYTGTVGALTVYGLTGLVLICAGLYAWGRVLHNRTAGILAVVLALPIPAVLHNARDITFYPVVNGSAVILAAATAALVRYRGLAPAVGVGASAGLLLLLDVRGLLLGIAFAGLALVLAALRGASFWLRVGRVLAVALPLVVSWQLSARYQNPSLIGLWPQAMFYVDETARQAGVSPWWTPYEVRPLPAPDMVGPPRIECDFQWGRGTPSDLRCAIGRISEFNRDVPDQVRSWSEATAFQNSHFWPWIPPVGVATALAAFGLRRKPWQAVALVATLAPFAYLFVGMARMLPQLRFLSLYGLAAPVIFGVALSLLAEPVPPGSDEAAPPAGFAKWPVRALVMAVACIVVVVRGGPAFARGLGFVNETDPQTTLQAVLSGRAAIAEVGSCARLLADESQRGLPVQPTLFGETGLLGPDGSVPAPPPVVQEVPIEPQQGGNPGTGPHGPPRGPPGPPSGPAGPP